MVEKFKEDIPRIRAYAPERRVLLRNYHISMLFEEVEQFNSVGADQDSTLSFAEN